MEADSRGEIDLSVKRLIFVDTLAPFINEVKGIFFGVADDEKQSNQMNGEYGNI